MGEHAHGGDPNLAHHFENMDQQVNAAKLGMWLFLATEVLLFAGLFCAYAVFRANHPDVFEYGSHSLDVKLGALNTIVLLASSWTVAMAVRAAQLGQRDNTTKFLIATLIGALAFLGIKAVEYTGKVQDDKLWGAYYRPQKPVEAGYEEWGAHDEDDEQADGDEQVDGDERAGGDVASDAVDPAVAELLGGDDVAAKTPWDGSKAAQERSAIPPPSRGPPGLAEEGQPRIDLEKKRNVHWYFGIYFIMTGTHGLHVIIGAIAIIWVLRRNMRGDFSPHYNHPVDLVGLYWHLVDLIWIFLFPLLYLIDVQGGS